MKTVTITGANTFAEISDSGWNSDTLTMVFPNATTNVAKWTVFGSATYPVTLQRTGSSGAFTLNYTGTSNISVDYVNVSNGNGLPASTWYMGANSIDGGGNTGFIFTYGAVRYWVGGTGTWDGTSTTNWAYQSGYAGGAPAPTSADDVYFDSNSSVGAFTVTIDSNFVGTGSISGTTLTITAVTKGSLSVGQNIYYNITNTFLPDYDLANISIQEILTGTGGIGTYRLNVNMGTISSRTLYSSISRCRDRVVSTTNSLTFTGSAPTVVSGSIEDSSTTVSSGYSSAIILNSSYNCRLGISSSQARLFLTGSNNRTLISSIITAALYVYSGGINTANFTVSSNAFGSSASLAVNRSINLGHSSIYLNSSFGVFSIRNVASLISFDAINSTFYFISPAHNETQSFRTDGLLYGNIVYRIESTYPYYGTFFINGNLNCRNLNIESSQTYPGIQINVIFNTGIASSSAPVYVNISEKFTFRGISAVSRKVLIASAGDGSSSNAKPSKIYITANQYDIDFADFRDVEFTNTTISGQSIGDLGNNTNIQFTPPKTVYWKNTSTSYVPWRSASYALTEDGVASIDNYPLPQDTVIFTDGNIGASASIGFLQPSDGIAGNIDMSRLTKPLTFNWTAFTAAGGYKGLYGDFILSDSVTINSNTALTFYNRKNSVIDTKGKNANGYFFNSENCTLTIQSPLVTSGAITLVRGNLSMLADITCDNFSITDNGNFIRSVNFGENFINLTGTNKVLVNMLSSGNGWSCSGTKTFILQGSPTSGTREIGGINNGSQDQVYSIRVLGGSDIIYFWNLRRFNNIIFQDTHTGLNSILWIYLYGDLRFSSNMTITPTPSGTTHDFYFVGSKEQKVTTNGIDIPRIWIISKDVGSSLILQDDVNLVQSLANNQKLDLQQGTLNLNGHKIITSTFVSSNSTSPRSINFNNGIISVSGSAFSNTVISANLSILGPGTINMTSSSAKTFEGGSINYSGIILNQGGSGDLTITGSNTFKAISNTSRPGAIILTSSTTTTVNRLLLNGSELQQTSLRSSIANTRANLNMLDDNISSYNLTVKDISATGKSLRVPANYGNINDGNNLNCDFTNVNKILDDNFSLFGNLIVV